MEETIKKYVEEILEEMPETRGNDTLLQFNVLKRMRLARVDGSIFKIDLRNMDSLPSFETIRRIRQVIQSPKGENRLYPSENIERARKRKEEETHSEFSNKEVSSGIMANSWMS